MADLEYRPTSEGGRLTRGADLRPCSRLPRRQFARRARALRRAAEIWHLGEPEFDVLAFVMLGLSNQEIAQRRSCSHKTVELHVRNILRKARLRNRVALLSWLLLQA
jgi:DNA-binding NarL/FixJ family response regulator